MNELLPSVPQAEETYTTIRSTVISAQNRVYAAVNSAMVQAYFTYLPTEEELRRELRLEEFRRIDDAEQPERS